MWRLRWAADGGRRFLLPRGTYRWAGYRLVDGEWHVSVSDRHGALGAIEVGDDTRRIEVQPALQVRVMATPREGSVQVQVSIQGHDGGLTIYRDGRRIPLTATLVDGDGREVGSAGLRYG